MAVRRRLSAFTLRHPLLRELSAVRRYTDAAFAAEHLAEMAAVWRERQILRAQRNGRDVCWIEDGRNDEPLVTIRIATQNRPEQLLDSAIASALRQTYPRIEVLVVGDGASPATGEALQRLNDPRVRYVNLPRQGRYPSDPFNRWMVAGSKPMNAALLLAAGEWIAPCDDDDEFTDDHVAQLLSFCKAKRLEFAWSNTARHQLDGSIDIVGDDLFRLGGLTHGSIIYSAGLDFLLYSSTSYRIGQPFDWNLWRRMQLAGARMGYLDLVTYKYWRAGPEQYETKMAKLPGEE